MEANQVKIMIADDDPGILDAVEIMLDYKGYQVITSSENTLKLLETERPDLLLLDIWMSGQDGIEICKKLKADQAYNSLPILMISASKDIEQSALNAGADDFIAKPFEMELLIDKIEALLNREA